MAFERFRIETTRSRPEVVCPPEIPPSVGWSSGSRNACDASLMSIVTSAVKNTRVSFQERLHTFKRRVNLVLGNCPLEPNFIIGGLLEILPPSSGNGVLIYERVINLHS